MELTQSCTILLGGGLGSGREKFVRLALRASWGSSTGIVGWGFLGCLVGSCDMAWVVTTFCNFYSSRADSRTGQFNSERRDDTSP